METYRVHTIIRDINISNKDQKKLKKLEKLEDQTYWTFFMNDDKIEKWHKESLLEQDLSVVYNYQSHVTVTMLRTSSIEPSQITLCEKALGVKCHDIRVNDKEHIELSFSFDPKDYRKHPKTRVATKDKISQVPMIGIKRVEY